MAYGAFLISANTETPVGPYAATRCYGRALAGIQHIMLRPLLTNVLSLGTHQSHPHLGAFVLVSLPVHGTFFPMCLYGCLPFFGQASN